MQSAVEKLIIPVFKTANLRASRYHGWIADRMQINIEKRLLKLDLDMLLEPFVKRPGKQWWAGEHIGKYLHAATCAWQFTGDDRLKQRLDSTVAQLIDTQLSDGYLGTYKESDQFGWGDGLSWDGPVWDVWTHKYVLIGLLSYYQATDHAPALTACKRAADLMYELFVVKKRSFRLASAHMGMAATSVLEPIAVLYRLTGEQRYLEFCHVIVNAWEDQSNPETWMYEDGCQLLTSLLETGNVYTTANRKAYEMLSNLIGLLELYQVDPDERFFTAAKKAWQDIATNRLYMTGTASYFEQFTQDDRLPPGQAVGEGCVTVTWLQLTHRLFELTGEVQYADELERTIYNALPAAQSPQTGEVTYFVPLLGRKNFNSHDEKITPAISCCSSSIPRGMAMVPKFVSGVLNGNPALLQYIPGSHVLHLEKAGDNQNVILQVTGDYPSSGDIQIAVEVERAAQFAIILRVPFWTTGFKATVSGKDYAVKNNHRLLEINRTWTSGDTINVQIPLEIRVVRHQDKTLDSVAFVRGPQVLAVDKTMQEGSEVFDARRWGNDFYSCVAMQNGIETEFEMVSIADAGQSKEAYAVLHDGIDGHTVTTLQKNKMGEN